MIANGTRVQVDMENSGEKSVISLLNHIGGTVVMVIGEKRSRIGYLVAYDEKHLPEIERARELDDKNGAGKIYFHILGKQRAKQFPGDKRYYLLAFETELQPV